MVSLDELISPLPNLIKCLNRDQKLLRRRTGLRLPSSVLAYHISLGKQPDKRHSQGWLIRGNAAQEKGGKDL